MQWPGTFVAGRGLASRGVTASFCARNGGGRSPKVGEDDSDAVAVDQDLLKAARVSGGRRAGVAGGCPSGF